MIQKASQGRTCPSARELGWNSLPSSCRPGVVLTPDRPLSLSRCNSSPSLDDPSTSFSPSGSAQGGGLSRSRCLRHWTQLEIKMINSERCSYVPREEKLATIVCEGLCSVGFRSARWESTPGDWGYNRSQEDVPSWEPGMGSRKIALSRWLAAASDFTVGPEPELEPRYPVGLSSLIPAGKTGVGGR